MNHLVQFIRRHAVISLIPFPTLLKQNRICDAVSIQASGTKILGLIFRLFLLLHVLRCEAEVVARKDRPGLLGN
jgi:hypothetical protein